MINKQSVWFVTLFSLIIVLSIYYFTMSDNSLASILNEAKESESQTEPVSSEVSESSILISLRVKDDEDVLKELNDYQTILLDQTKSSDEKNNAYNSLMTLSQKKSEEEKIEKKIKSTHNLDSFVKIRNDTISITISSSEHTPTIANNIIRTVQSLYDQNKYITVKFQTT